MFLARKSRLAGSVHDSEARDWIAGRMGHLFRKSRVKYEEIFRAMEARGFNGEVRLPAFDRLDNLSRLSGCLFLLAGLFLLWI
jgi:energy-coupling factor transporter transmembrane protein EcfT